MNDLYFAARLHGWHWIMDRSPPGQQPQKGAESSLVAVNHCLHRRRVGVGLVAASNAYWLTPNCISRCRNIANQALDHRRVGCRFSNGQSTDAAMVNAAVSQVVKQLHA